MNILSKTIAVCLFVLMSTAAFAADPLDKDQIADIARQDLQGQVQEVTKANENNMELWKVTIKDDKGEEHILYYDERGVRVSI